VTGDGTTGPGRTRITPTAAVAVGTSDDGKGEATANRNAKDVSPYNEALPFIEFIADHPVGSEVEATVERFSSHGAYVLSGDARGYVPLRNLAQPAPRSAREVLNLGEVRRFVVIAIDPPRRGIDLALPGVVEVAAGSVAPVEEQVVEALGITDASAPGKTPAARKAKAAANRTSTRRAAAKKAAAKKPSVAKRTSKKAPANATVAKRAPTRDSARKAPGPPVAPKKTRTKRATAKRGTAKKAPAPAHTAKAGTAKAGTAKAGAAKAGAAKAGAAKEAPRH